MNYIIGAGGVGSWLAPSICMLRSPSEVTIIDGDKLEKKNLNRQLFTEAEIGKPKSVALAERYRCKAVDSYYSHGIIELKNIDWLFCCVDNNAGRQAVLDSCDRFRCRAIFGANEVHSAEAYYYEPKWKGTDKDPRVYYPEIETDKSDDPRHAAIGCTGEAQERNRQLVTANFMAAALMQHIYVLWGMERQKFDAEAIEHFPFKIRQNLTKYETLKPKDYSNE